MTKQEIINRVFVTNKSGKTEYSEKASRLLYHSAAIDAKELEIAKYTGIIQKTKEGNHDSTKDNFACGFCFEYAADHLGRMDGSGSPESFDLRNDDHCNPCTDCPVSGKFKKNGTSRDGCNGINNYKPEEILEVINNLEV